MKDSPDALARGAAAKAHASLQPREIDQLSNVGGPEATRLLARNIVNERNAARQNALGGSEEGDMAAQVSVGRHARVSKAHGAECLLLLRGGAQLRQMRDFVVKLEQERDSLHVMNGTLRRELSELARSDARWLVWARTQLFFVLAGATWTAHYNTPTAHCVKRMHACWPVYVNWRYAEKEKHFLSASPSVVGFAC